VGQGYVVAPAKRRYAKEERGNPALTTPRRLIAGNWKMHGLAAALAEARAVAAAVDEQSPAARVALCPPATLIHRMAELLGGSGVEVGGQDCRAEPQGAFTGCLSAEMLADAGARLVILGHSECRELHRETSAEVAAKVAAALRAGLEPIVCVGEGADDHAAGRTLEVVLGQVAQSLPEALRGHAFSVAYEPIWAIGSGHTPSLDEIEAVHAAIRSALVERWAKDGDAPILYGGSVNGGNAAEILTVPDVGGALVGGASLTANQFLPIVRAA
jgi:triosephosphate isomerase